jgi:hypothetical protein
MRQGSTGTTDITAQRPRYFVSAWRCIMPQQPIVIAATETKRSRIATAHRGDRAVEPTIRIGPAAPGLARSETLTAPAMSGKRALPQTTNSAADADWRLGDPPGLADQHCYPLNS